MAHPTNSLIKETLALGERLLFQKYSAKEAKVYQSLVYQIANDGIKTHTNNTQKRTCAIILNTHPENYTLNIFEKIYYFFTSFRYNGGLILIKNTPEQMTKRYILDMNSKLPILKN